MTQYRAYSCDHGLYLVRGLPMTIPRTQAEWKLYAESQHLLISFPS